MPLGDVDILGMKICVIGAPSTGKSVFARSLSAEMSKKGMSCELVQEYASLYIQQAGAPEEAWEQLIISIGQYLAEQRTTRDHMVTDAAAFVTYTYAQRLVPKMVDNVLWPKYRTLLDTLRTLARMSATSYDLIFLLTYVFPPRSDGVRLATHLSREVCQDINKDIEEFLESERVEFFRLKANDPKAIDKALAMIDQRALIGGTSKAENRAESEKLSISTRPY